MNNSEQPAFPAPDTIHPETGQRFEPLCAGLTKREYFAGQALMGLISAIDGQLTTAEIENYGFQRQAVKLADALLAELAKPEQP